MCWRRERENKIKLHSCTNYLHDSTIYSNNIKNKNDDDDDTVIGVFWTTIIVSRF
jgi:hypothetical protein